MDFLSLLENRGILLFDGSLGAQLILRGLKAGEIPDSWNIKKPEIIRELFREYYNSGSDIVQTATFRANGVALKGYGMEGSIYDINIAAGKLLREICPEFKCVIGDIGPSGEFLPPVGKITEKDLELGFKKQVQALSPYIDAWHLETFSDLHEMKIAIESVRSESKKPIIASMTYKQTPKGFFTIMGNSLPHCIDELMEIGVNIIGSNCTLGSNEFIDLTKAMRECTPDFPISIKPNAGQPIIEEGLPMYKQTPQEFAEDMKKILDLNIQIVGGCCGTGPQHIKLLRKVIDEVKTR
jgi:5-methyltetrahydrofolate--homocysteine methyltransferase